MTFQQPSMFSDVVTLLVFGSLGGYLIFVKGFILFGLIIWALCSLTVLNVIADVYKASLEIRIRANKEAKKCESCKHSKLIRRLNTNQDLRRSMANALYEPHRQSREKKYEMLEEVVREFCKIGEVNINQSCNRYEWSWWKLWA